MLVALDGSATARSAIPFARTLAEALGGNLEVLHVAPEAVDESDIRRLLGLDGPEAAKARLRVRIGEPVEEICRFCRHPDVAFVVLTTYGWGEPGANSALGPIAEQVAAAITRPVVFVRPSLRRRSAPYVLRRLLVPVDETRRTAEALKHVTEIAERLGATSLDVLYVSPMVGKRTARNKMRIPLYVDQPAYEWPEWEARVLRRLWQDVAVCSPNLEVGVFLRVGNPATEIERFAREREVDAIVAVRGRGLESGRGKVLRSLLRKAPCPIIFIPARSRAPRRTGAQPDAPQQADLAHSTPPKPPLGS